MAELLSMESKRNNEKQKALDSALAQIERQSGFRGGRRLPDRGISGFMDDASGVENS